MSCHPNNETFENLALGDSGLRSRVPLTMM